MRLVLGGDSRGGKPTINIGAIFPLCTDGQEKQMININCNDKASETPRKRTYRDAGGKECLDPDLMNTENDQNDPTTTHRSVTAIETKSSSGAELGCGLIMGCV
jgi:hypothetical protein